jgi:hypothetical protein
LLQRKLDGGELDQSRNRIEVIGKDLKSKAHGLERNRTPARRGVETYEARNI